VVEERQQRTREALRFCQDGLALFERHRTLQGGDVDPPYQAFLCTVQGTDLAKKGKDLAGAIKLADQGSTIAEAFRTPAQQRERLDLSITLAGCCDEAGQTEKAISTWSRVHDEAARLIKERSFDFGARVKLKDSFQQLAKLHRRQKALKAEIEVARELLPVWSYFDGKDYGKLLAETADVNEGSAQRLRTVLETPPKMTPDTLMGHKIYLVEALQPFEDQLRWIKEVEGSKYSEVFAKLYRDWHKKCVENKVSFVELCNYAVGTGRIEDENKAGITRALKEITQLSQQLEATPGLPLRRRLAESYTTLAKEYALNSGSREAGARAVETALSYLDLTPQGEPRHRDDRRTLAQLRFLQANLEQEAGKDERVYDALLNSVRLFPETLRSGWGPDDRRKDLGKLCAKLGRKTEAAYWFLTAAELGDDAAFASLRDLYLEEPGVGALLPELLVHHWEALRQTTPTGKDKEKVVDQVKEAWKKHRVETLVASPTLSPAERGRLLAELDVFDQAERILTEALKMSPNDPPLQTALAICYRKRGSSLYSKERYDEAASAYRRSLEAGGDSDSPELLADYLKTLIMAGQAKQVQAEAARFGPGGPGAPKNFKGDPSWDHVSWRLCAVAAALLSEDSAPFLAKARATAPVVRIRWKWDDVKGWQGMPRLMPDQKKRLDALTGELASILLEGRAGKNASMFEKIIGDEYAIIFLQGKNGFGEIVYCFVRVGLADISRMGAIVRSGKNFNPSDFGVVAASGKGDPTAAVKRELAKTYPMVDKSIPLTLSPNAPASRDAPASSGEAKSGPYLAPLSHGMSFLREGRYEDALPQLKMASESKQAVADDFTLLGRCYGRLSRWDEAFAAHRKAVELEAKQTTGSDATLGLLEAFLLRERPEKVGPFIIELMAKKSQPREETTTRRIQASALFYGFQAVAQRMLGQEATDLEKKMRQNTSQTRMENMDWRWDEMDAWLKGTKLSPDRKAAVEKIIAELKGLAAPAPK
jgi:tetratricopeptide (TPR) repeat protein